MNKKHTWYNNVVLRFSQGTLEAKLRDDYVRRELALLGRTSRKARSLLGKAGVLAIYDDVLIGPTYATESNSTARITAEILSRGNTHGRLGLLVCSKVLEEGELPSAATLPTAADVRLHLEINKRAPGALLGLLASTSKPSSLRMSLASIPAKKISRVEQDLAMFSPEPTVGELRTLGVTVIAMEFDSQSAIALSAGVNVSPYAQLSQLYSPTRSSR